GPPPGAPQQALTLTSLAQPHGGENVGGGGAGAAPLGAQVAGPAAQLQNLAQPPQPAQHVQHHQVQQQQRRQHVDVPGSIHQGYMPGGTAPAGGAMAEAGGVSWQSQGNPQTAAHHSYQQQQQQQAQLRAPIAQLPHAMQPAGPPIASAPTPWLGSARAANTDFGVGSNNNNNNGSVGDQSRIRGIIAAAAGTTATCRCVAASAAEAATGISSGGRVASGETGQETGGAAGPSVHEGLRGGGGDGGGGSGALFSEIVTLIDSDSGSGDCAEPQPSMDQTRLNGPPNPIPNPQPSLRQQQQIHLEQHRQEYPELLRAQQHQQRLQEQNLPRRRLPTSTMQAASLLGGSAAPPSAASLQLGASTSSPTGLLPPRPTAATRANTPGTAIPPTGAATITTTGAAGTGITLRKAALPLARSSPTPSVSSLGSGGRSGAGHVGASATAAASPTRSTAALGSTTNRSDARASGHAALGTGGGGGGGGGGAAARVGRGAGLAVEVEMVDLADLDDDDDCGDGKGNVGGSGALGGNGAAQPGDAPLPQAVAREPWCDAEGSWGCHSLPGSVRRPPDKRPRLSSAQRNGDEGKAGSIGADSGATGGVQAIVHGAADGTGGRSECAALGSAAGTVAAELVPETQMDFDCAHFGHPLAEPAAEVEEWRAPGVDAVVATAMVAVRAHRTFPADGAVAGSDHLHQNLRPGGGRGGDGSKDDSMAVELLDSDMTFGHSGSPAVPPRPMAATVAAAAGRAQQESRVQTDCASSNHAGAVWLCQVADMLRPEPDCPEVPVTFPMTLDVYGVVYELDGDRAVIEDGTDMMEAQLTDSALAPLLVGTQLPPGVATGTTSLGLEDIWAMVDSLDPAMQACGQELADRIMAFFRDFSGLIRLEFRGPPPVQPLIIQVTSDGRGSGADACGGLEGDNSCELYRTYLRTAGALPVTDMDGEDAVA
ncbi:hypothetical protein Vafri_1360, partial [Volvox africanus]